MAVNAQFTVGKRFKGKRPGCRGLYLLAIMHHQDDVRIEFKAGNRPADAAMEMHPAALATFEAIARALGIIESPDVQAGMEDLFSLMVQRTLDSRGVTGA